jgi:Ca-activated chloride channel family protein
MDSPQLLYLLVKLRPAQQEEDTRLPLNLCLVLDRSTSMRGERLNQAKTAVEMMVDKLGPDDELSVVSFSDRADVLISADTAGEKRHILSRVKGMIASGGTEIFQGLVAGVRELKQRPLRRYHNHLILLTDGHTYGDADKCIRLAKQVSTQGIGLTAFGLGDEWNDLFLDRLVAPSGGQSGYVEAPEQILAYLQERIQGLGAAHAQDVRLRPEFPESIQIRYGYKLTPYAQPLSLDEETIQLGDIEGRRPLSCLLEIKIAPQSIETRVRLPLRLTATIPSQQREVSLQHTFQLLVLKDPPQVDPPESLLKAVRMLNIYRLNEKVWSDVEAGQIAAATTRMRHLTTRFLEAGETKLAQHANLEADRLERLGEISSEGRKTLKFGTRTLMTQSLTQHLTWDEDE